MNELDISQIRLQAAAFERELTALKASLPVDFPWYPYHTLSAFEHFDALLTGANRGLIGAQRGGAVLDIGCGDGDTAFFLERLGYRVVVVDYPAYNHNGLRGIKRLKKALGSSVEILEMDLDQQFWLPDDQFSFTFLMGVLYHLRNPFFVLDTISRRSTYCFASTRVARRFPGGQPIPENLSVAYLLDEKELNDDDSNYFIFSNRGLRVTLKRTRWEVLDWMSVGDRESSDPTSLSNDERVYCLLRSRFGLRNAQLLEGWYSPEGSGWRWTARSFAVKLTAPAGAGRKLIAVGFVSAALVKDGPVTLLAECNGVALVEREFESEGEFTYMAPVPDSITDSVVARFQLSRAIPPAPSDTRELGLVIASVAVE